MPDSARFVIIGSGVAGGLVAQILLDSGFSDIVMLEAGPPIAMKDQRVWLDVVMAGTTPYGDLYDEPSDYISSGVTPWQITGGRLFGRGGSTIHWGGWCPRFMPEDFELYSRTGAGIDWPYRYADLEPYYVKAENFLQVSGEMFSGQRDWRSAPYPLTAATYPLTACPIIDVLDSMEISYQHMPVARNTVSINGQAACQTTGTCHYCPFGARFTGDQAIDVAETKSGFKLITGAAVRRLIMGSRNRVMGVEYVDGNSGETRQIFANAVFVCAGAFETPKLLLASKNGYWPNGIGNNHDLVGRYLVANPYIYSRGTDKSNPEKLQQELNFPTLCSRYWDSPAEQARGKFLMNMSYGAPEMNPAALMYEGVTADEIFAATTGEVKYEIQGAIAPFPHYDNRVTLAPGTTRFGLPKTVISTPYPLVSDNTIQLNVQRASMVLERMGFGVVARGAYPQRGDHSASTCRMAMSPEQGVVDTMMRVYGVSNLYIASNAILPTIGAANLTLTLVAVIMKAMEALIRELPK